MTCLRCGEQTRVISTRFASSPNKGFTRRNRAEAERVVGWYTSDWSHRQRHCMACRARLTTIEIYVEDIEAMIAERVKDVKR